MDGTSPIDAFLIGRLSEDELLAEIDRVMVEGSLTDRTILISDWRTKSGRIRDSETRRRLDAKVHPLSWQTQVNADYGTDKVSAGSGKSLQPGDVLAGRFVIETKIGSGGMGTVFKARDLRREEAQDRHPYVAVKTLNIDVLLRDDSLKILQREARKAQGLAHPNIVRVHDFDRDGGTLFLTMELLEGTSLDAILRKNGSQGAPMADLLPILRQIVSALQFAHSEGIVHSDLKPANVIVLPNGRVKVIDFGISRAIPNPNQLTSELTTFDVKALGAMTPAYASPEMIDGLDPDPRDDVFALACIIYELLTGRHPFGRAPASVARAGNYIPQQPANLSPAQWRVLQAGLHFDRAKRVSSAEQLLAGLAPQAAVRSAHRWTYAGTALGLLIALGLGIYFAVTGDMIGFEWLRTFEAKDRPITNESATASGASDQTAGHSGAINEGAQQKAAEEATQQLAQRKAAEEAAQRLAQQRAAEEAAQRQAQQRAAEEAAQSLAQQKAAEEAAQRQAQQKAAEEAEQRQSQQQPAQQVPQSPSDQVGPTQIAEAQRLLASMGLSPGAANGKMSPRTQEMVRAFQSIMGLPPTGELTMTLLETLRGPVPPVAARARSLFTLAAEARNARRFGDAIRLYEAALKLAPNDPDGLLALGDLRRDANDLEAARRAYETLANGHGAAAGIARQRLAGLPNQQQPSSEQTTRDAATQAARTQPGEQQANRSGDPSARINAPTHVDPTRPFDGTYTGVRQLTGFSSPTCRPTLSTTITVRDGKLSFLANVTTSVTADGSFSEYGPVAGIVPPISQHLTGRIQNGIIEADTTDQNCKYHMSLKKGG
jgi:peptidoglycan hydrolase-like protein with peptidoglycan-binding domain